MLALALTTVACGAPPVNRSAPTTVPVRLACDASKNALVCKTLSPAASESTEPADLGTVVEWSSSDDRVASVHNGRVAGRLIGTATITARLATTDRNGSASTIVVVQERDGAPQIAYEIEGAVRDSSNSGVARVEVTLVDPRGRMQPVKTTSGLDELFHFAPVPCGSYLVRASRSDYRAIERDITVPDARPLTLVLLADPTRDATMTFDGK
jgi:Carboxypeptidase regulatory-like domain/Bacterial Ig-like domain (group 2)